MNSIIPWDEWVALIEPYYPEGKRDEEMHQTKKGNEWYFGMKVRKSSGRLTFLQNFPNFWFTMGTRGEYGL